jgi:hypothetical protein
MAIDMDEALNGEDGAIKAVEKFQEEYSKKMEELREDTQGFIEKVNLALEKWKDYLGLSGSEGPDPKDPPETVQGGGTDDGTGGTNGGETGGSEDGEVIDEN